MKGRSFPPYASPHGPEGPPSPHQLELLGDISTAIFGSNPLRHNALQFLGPERGFPPSYSAMLWVYMCENELYYACSADFSVIVWQTKWLNTQS
jgi:hypothetical protein